MRKTSQHVILIQKDEQKINPTNLWTQFPLLARVQSSIDCGNLQGKKTFEYKEYRKLENHGITLNEYQKVPVKRINKYAIQHPRAQVHPRTGELLLQRNAACGQWYMLTFFWCRFHSFFLFVCGRVFMPTQWLVFFVFINILFCQEKILQKDTITHFVQERQLWYQKRKGIISE